MEHCAYAAAAPLIPSFTCKQWRSTENNNRAEKCLNKKTDKKKKKSSVKRKNWTKPERKQGLILEHHFRGGGSCGICKDLSDAELTAFLLDK